jgi:hypothetical protein
MTVMQFLPPDIGSPFTKSIEMLCQAIEGTGNG